MKKFNTKKENSILNSTPKADIELDWNSGMVHLKMKWKILQAVYAENENVNGNRRT